MPEIISVGLDLANNLVQVHGADDAGRAVLRSQPTFRAMALMLSPCFFRSWIKTISLSHFT